MEKTTSTFFDRLEPALSHMRQSLTEFLPTELHGAITDPSFACRIILTNEFFDEQTCDQLKYPLLSSACSHIYSQFRETNFRPPIVEMQADKIDTIGEFALQDSVPTSVLDENEFIAYYKLDNESALPMYHIKDITQSIPIILKTNDEPTKEFLALMDKAEQDSSSLTEENKAEIMKFAIPEDEVKNTLVHAEGVFINARKGGVFGLICPKAFDGISALELPLMFLLECQDDEDFATALKRGLLELDEAYSAENISNTQKAADDISPSYTYQTLRRIIKASVGMMMIGAQQMSAKADEKAGRPSILH